MTSISIIVAMDENNLIGANNRLPWHLPNDLKHFKRNTVGKPILMGRRTFESIGRPLPERVNLVLSRDAGFVAAGCHTVRSLDEALAHAGDAAELMVIGGSQLYALALPRTQRIYLTRVHGRFTGDTWFPELNEGEWDIVEQSPQVADERNPYAHSFLVLERY